MKLSEQIRMVATMREVSVSRKRLHYWIKYVAQLEDAVQESDQRFSDLQDEHAALKRENEVLRDGNDRWLLRWGMAFDILDTTQRRQYERKNLPYSRHRSKNANRRRHTHGYSRLASRLEATDGR